MPSAPRYGLIWSGVYEFVLSRKLLNRLAGRSLALRVHSLCSKMLGCCWICRRIFEMARRPHLKPFLFQSTLCKSAVDLYR